MVLTAAQTTAFIGNPDQMGIPHGTMVQMQQEEIQLVADLADFEKQSLICSFAVLANTNSDPYVAASTVACFLEYKSVGVWLQNGGMQ